MGIRIGLMGFGRIGRNIFRILYNRDDVQVAAISDIADPKSLEYLVRYDTIMGRFPATVAVDDGALYAHGRRIPMLAGADPGDVKWSDHDVDVVIEATARNHTRSSLQKHLDSGAQRVILCAPPLDAPDITVVMGINDDALTAKHRIISNASITAHCAAPVLKILHRAFGVERAFFSTVHAYTNDQRLADVPADSLRRSRAAQQNIIPVETNSVQVLEGLLPELAGRISGLAIKVPVPNGSLVDLTTFLKKPVTANAVNEVMRTATDTAAGRYVDYCTDPIVSSDITKSPASCTFDALATTVLDNTAVKTISWYDNGWGYAHRVVDLVRKLAKLEGGAS